MVNRENLKTYVYTAIDVYSRYGYAFWYQKANCYSSISFMKKVRRYFPFNIRYVQTDNGSEFSLHFTDYLNRNRISHRHIHPHSPNENGHLERFNRTLREETEKHGKCLTIKSDLKSYVTHYNTDRLHMGINYKTPQEMLK